MLAGFCGCDNPEGTFVGSSDGCPEGTFDESRVGDDVGCDDGCELG